MFVPHDANFANFCCRLWATGIYGSNESSSSSSSYVGVEERCRRRRLGADSMVSADVINKLDLGNSGSEKSVKSLPEVDLLDKIICSPLTLQYIFFILSNG